MTGEQASIFIPVIREITHRLFGVPEFHYYALADGIGFVLSLLRLCRPKGISPSAPSQLWLFHFS